MATLTGQRQVQANQDVGDDSAAGRCLFTGSQRVDGNKTYVDTAAQLLCGAVADVLR